ncbi:MAG: hypothetical protein CMN21_10380 [Rubinisphaera sp.]|nr:hypothetical protein [Rubinisphaera sp.]
MISGEINNDLLEFLTILTIQFTIAMKARVAGALSKRSPRIVEPSGASAKAERPRHPWLNYFDHICLKFLIIQNTGANVCRPMHIRIIP